MRLSSTQLEGSAELSVRRPDVVLWGDDEARRAEAGVFAELLELFEWQPEPAGRRTRAALERHHLEAVAARVNSRLPSRALVELEALPDDTYLTMIRSPEVFHAAFHAPQDRLAASLQRWIAVERARPGTATSLDGTVRSAGCDRHVTAAAGRVVAIDELPRLSTTGAGLGAGLGGGPVLDTDSELPARLVTRFPDRQLVPPSGDELAAIIEKLGQAFCLLREVSPAAHLLAHAMIQVVCVRTAVDEPLFTTASDATTLGVVHLANAHLPRKLPSELAAELVHEAIHQALLRWELRHPLLSDPRMAALKVRSPWTGVALDLHAYVHACFVSYGVANLWRQPSVAHDRGELAVVRQRRAAEAGFAHRPLERLGKHAFGLAPELQAAIEVMTERVAPI